MKAHRALGLAVTGCAAVLSWACLPSAAGSPPPPRPQAAAPARETPAKEEIAKEKLHDGTNSFTLDCPKGYAATTGGIDAAKSPSGHDLDVVTDKPAGTKLEFEVEAMAKKGAVLADMFWVFCAVGPATALQVFETYGQGVLQTNANCSKPSQADAGVAAAVDKIIGWGYNFAPGGTNGASAFSLSSVRVSASGTTLSEWVRNTGKGPYYAVVAVCGSPGKYKLASKSVKNTSAKADTVSATVSCPKGYYAVAGNPYDGGLYADSIRDAYPTSATTYTAGAFVGPEGALTLQVICI